MKIDTIDIRKKFDSLDKMVRKEILNSVQTNVEQNDAMNQTEALSLKTQYWNDIHKKNLGSLETIEKLTNLIEDSEQSTPQEVSIIINFTQKELESLAHSERESAKYVINNFSSRDSHVSSELNKRINELIGQNHHSPSIV